MTTTPTPSRRPRRRLAIAAIALATLGATTVALPSAPADAIVLTTITRLTRDPANGKSSGAIRRPFISTNGRFVAFSSQLWMTPQAQGAVDTYVRDRVTGAITLIDVTNAGAPTTGHSTVCGMSHDGRFVGFISDATELAGAGTKQLYVRDRIGATTDTVSVSTAGAVGNQPSLTDGQACPISDDGRYVAFGSQSTNLVSNDSNGQRDVFRRDRQSHVTIRVSVRDAGAQGAGASQNPALSADGNQVAFESTTTDLVAGDSNGVSDVFVRDVTNATTVRVSLGTGGTQLNKASQTPAMSSSGTSIAFASAADNAISGVAPTALSIYVYDRATATASLISQSTGGAIANKQAFTPTMSSNGTYIGFASDASNLANGDGNNTYDAFVRDRKKGTTELVSRTAAGAVLPPSSDSPVVSDSGNAVVFPSQAQLSADDSDAQADIEVLDRNLDLDPFGSAGDFVTQQYQDFIGRAPTAAELASTQTAVLQEIAGPDQLIDLLAHSTAWSGRRAPVTRLYWAFFLRVPDTGGLDFWVSKLAAGKTLAWVASQFALSPEFQATYGSLSNAAFVKLVYENVLQREPDAAGAAYWKGQLDTLAKTRGDCMVGFSESAEGKAFLAPQVDIVLVHLGMLRVMPSQATVSLILGSVKAGTPIETYISSLRHTSTYAARF